MAVPPRVAFFPDSFHEVNGVAHTARNFVAYARERDLPMLCVRASPTGRRRTKPLMMEGQLTTLELPRSRASIALEKDLHFDPLFVRHGRTIHAALRAFRPDVIHITGPSEFGILGAYFAWRLSVPLAASWHTNVHEYAGRRLARFARLLPEIPRWAERASLAATSRFYRLARVLYAPNEELCALLQQTTGRPCAVMPRGVDTELFAPERRTRPRDGGTPVVGYVGRLSVEKNVRLLPQLDAQLRAAGIPVQFVIIGQGEEQAALRTAMPTAHFPGVLRGEALAKAYADMDLFVFPSETDTFGNVVLEALASGVPAAVTTGGGPKFIVKDGVTGVVRPTPALGEALVDLLRHRKRLHSMSEQARLYALTCRWNAIFDGVYARYPAAGHPGPSQ